MCGIIGRVGYNDALETLVTGLSNLDYRGYDSAGVALGSTNGRMQIDVCKREGDVEGLRDTLDEHSLEGALGVGHTRWSTHGAPSDANAHPHTDCRERVGVVHNGIIENYEELRRELRSRGHTFASETDTEVVPHLIEERLSAGRDPETAVREVVRRLEGSYAIAVVVTGSDALYTARHGSPLVLGIGENANYLASDVPAFLEFTDEVVYLEDDDVAILRQDEWTVTDVTGTPVERRVETVEWAADDAKKAGYNHFMLKEIDEQPTALRQTIDGRTTDGGVQLETFPPGSLEDVDRVVFVACGTSHHAALYGCSLLRRRGIPATAHRANEFVGDPMPIDERTLVVAVTQSGETADTLASLRHANDTPARTLAVTNVVGSTAAREADDALFIRAGPEIGVAATKTFSSQVATLLLLAERMAADRGTTDDNDVLDALTDLPAAVSETISGDQLRRLAERYEDAESYFFIGRGVGYPVALEGALKFKEITYDHAEGFAAGELKHGPLALITPSTPLIAVFTGRNDEKTMHNIREAQSRGAPVVAIAPESTTLVHEAVDEFVEIPDVPPELAGILANVQLQLLAYHAAALRDRAIDKPRNLAKSVTVE